MILKESREKPQVTCKGKLMRIMADLAFEMLKAGEAWSNTLQVPKDHSCQTRLQCPEKLSALVEGEGKLFHDINILSSSCPPNHPSREY